MIRPPSARWSQASCNPWNTPLTLTAKLRSNSSSLISGNGLVIATAALLTSTSQRPYSPSSRWTMAWYSARLLMSAATARAVPPAAAMSATTAAAGSRVCGWLTTTRAPAAARAPAMAFPIPVAAPVTSAVLPARKVDWLMVRPPWVDGPAPESRAACVHRAGGPGWSLEPVIEMNLGALSQVGAEPARAAQPGQLAGAGPRHHEPLAAHDVALHCAGILQQERACPVGDRAPDPLDADKAGRPVGAAGLQEFHHAVALDVAAEALLDVDPGQDRPLGRLFVGRGLVLVHGDDRVRAHRPSAGDAHTFLPFVTNVPQDCAAFRTVADLSKGAPASPTFSFLLGKMSFGSLGGLSGHGRYRVDLPAIDPDRWPSGHLRWLLELEQADPVAVGVGEPGRQREPDVGDAVDSPQLRQVLDLDAARPQLRDLAGDVVHPPGGLGCLITRPGGTVGDHQPAVAPTAEGEELLVLQQHLQAQGVAVEAAGHAQIGRQQHHVNGVVPEHAKPSLVERRRTSSPPAGIGVEPSV